MFVDLWKDLYVPCLDAFYPRLNDGAIVAADNIIRPETDSVKKYQRAIRARPGMSSVLLPVERKTTSRRLDNAFDLLKELIATPLINNQP